MTAPTATNSARGLRAYAAAIRPTAADYAASLACGKGMDKLQAAADKAMRLERAAVIRGNKNRAGYLAAHGVTL